MSQNLAKHALQHSACTRRGRVRLDSEQGEQRSPRRRNQAARATPSKAENKLRGPGQHASG